MPNKIDIKSTVGGILQSVLTAVFILALGTLFSLLTGYKANDYPNILRIVVWSVNIILCWFVSSGLLKIFFRKNVSFFSLKYMTIAIVFSVLFVWGCGFGDDDYAYVTTFSILLTIVGSIWGIKLIVKKRGRPSKKC